MKASSLPGISYKFKMLTEAARTGSQELETAGLFLLSETEPTMAEIEKAREELDNAEKTYRKSVTWLPHFTEASFLTWGSGCERSRKPDAITLCAMISTLGQTHL